MGVILKGHDTDLGRDVAVKVLDPELAKRPEVVQRFVEEAQKVVNDQAHLPPGYFTEWAGEYERDAADVLKLEAEVARTIAQEIQAHLTPEETRRLASARSISPDQSEVRRELYCRNAS